MQLSWPPTVTSLSTPGLPPCLLNHVRVAYLETATGTLWTSAECAGEAAR